MSELAPNPAAAVAFLRMVYPASPWALAALPPGGGPLTFGIFTPDESAKAEAWIAQQNGTERRQVYYHLNQLRAGPPRKAKKEDVAAVHYLHVDLDPRAGEDRDAERSRMRALLRDNLPEGVPPPSFVIDSGNGYQALWKLDAPIPLGEQRPAAEVERYTRWLEVRFAADATHNVDRILRLPGTINWKTAKGRQPAPAKIEQTKPELVYPLAAFRQLADVAPALPAGATPAAVTPSANLPVFALADDLPLSPRLRLIALEGHIAEEPKPDGTRSTWANDFTCNAIRELQAAGWAEERINDTIFAAITTPHFKITNHTLYFAAGGKRPDPLAFARRQIANAWKQVAKDEKAQRNNGEGWITGNGGVIAPNHPENVRLALARLGIALRYDEFGDKFTVAIGGGDLRRLEDSDFITWRFDVERKFNFLPGKDLFEDVVKDESFRNRFNPVCDYLAQVQAAWDGKPRIERWLINYGGADDTPLNRAIGRLILLAAVRRVRDPGCKFDEMLTLESEQGTHKSTALRILAVRPEWFNDYLPFAAKTSEKIEAIKGRWIVEAAEVTGLKRGEVESVKAFLSRSTDAGMRLAYGRVERDYPRQCVFIGTTNDESYLADMSGNRRFWPVRVRKFDTDALLRDRDQLWAEAAAAEAAGESIRLDPKLYAAAGAEQEKRRKVTAIEERLSELFDGDYEGKLPKEEVWRYLGVFDETKKETLGSKLTEAMKKLGWKTSRPRNGMDPKTKKEKRPHCYVRGDESRWVLVKNANADTPMAPPVWQIEFSPSYEQLMLKDA